jgi:UMF1 family MFS transporter
MSAPQHSRESGPSSGKAVVGWCLFDWANSPFPTLITTFVFSAYFTKAVAETPEQGTSQWGWMVGLTGLLIAILAPVFGTVADRCGPRKPWLAGFSLLCVGGSALLWWVEPQASDALYALVCVGIATLGFEIGTVFYNAMLPEITSRQRLGRISGWAWGLGYAGGLAALLVVLLLFVQAKVPPWGLDPAHAEQIRISGPMVALWFAVFALPLFLWVPDRPRQASIGQALAHTKQDLAHLWSLLRTHPTIGRFLVARMIYIDGLNTLFAFGGIYAAGTFNMPFSDIILLGIAMNVSAGVGAAAFGWLDDRIGARATISMALLAVIGFSAGLLVIDSVVLFWLLAIPMGLFFGPAQSASRSLMARLAPAEARTEMFGLFALSGKITSFAGPLVLAWVTAITDNQRLGMSTVIVFLVVGLVLLRRLPDNR